MFFFFFGRRAALFFSHSTSNIFSFYPYILPVFCYIFLLI